MRNREKTYFIDYKGEKIYLEMVERDWVKEFFL